MCNTKEYEHMEIDQLNFNYQNNSFKVKGIIAYVKNKDNMWNIVPK